MLSRLGLYGWFLWAVQSSAREAGRGFFVSEGSRADSFWMFLELRP